MTYNRRLQLIFGVSIGLLSLFFIVLPIVAGLLGTWLPALGYLPSVGYNQYSWQPTIEMFNHPSTWSSIRLSLGSTVLATCGAFVMSQWLCMQLYRSRSWLWVKHSLGPLLAIPHLAFAIGFAFVIAPSGWLMRLISPQLSGFDIPPDWLIVNDNYALSLSVALVIKEIPFFVLMTLSAMTKLNVDKTLQVAASLGYTHNQGWIKLVFPQLFSSLRLPFYAVLSYSLSVVDLSIVLGPAAPSTFAVLINEWFNQPDLSMRLVGASAASLLLLLLVALIGLFYVVEVLITKHCRDWLVAGVTAKKESKKESEKESRVVAKFLSHSAILVIAASSLLAMSALMVWSFSRQWRFPDLLPTRWSFKNWQRSAEQLIDPLINTALIGLASALLALVMSVIILQWQSQQNKKQAKSTHWVTGIVYFPLLLPQISFLFGIQIMLVALHLEGQLSSMIWVHFLFVLPYCYLSLAKVYLAFDDRYLQLGAMLSQSLWRSFWKVKIPMLFKPLAFSFAVGFAVSVSQYLPSLYVGAGRIETITLESVAAASGSDLRVSAVFAIWQFVLPLIVYALAIFIPQWCFAKRKAMN